MHLWELGSKRESTWKSFKEKSCKTSRSIHTIINVHNMKKQRWKGCIVQGCKRVYEERRIWDVFVVTMRCWTHSENLSGKSLVSRKEFSNFFKTLIHLSMVHGCFCPMVRIWSMLLDYIGLPNRIRMNPVSEAEWEPWSTDMSSGKKQACSVSEWISTRFRSKVSHVVRERKDQNGSEWYCSCWMYFVSTTWCLFARFCAVIESAVGSPVYAVASNNSCNWQRWPLGSEVGQHQRVSKVWNTRMSSQCSEDSYGRLWTPLDQGKCRAVLILFVILIVVHEVS